MTGTANHPLLCLVDVGGVPTLLWKLIEEIRPDDYVVLQRTPPMEFGPADWLDAHGSAAVRRIHQRGLCFQNCAGFANLDRDYFTMVVVLMTRSSAASAVIYQTTNRIGFADARAHVPTT